MEGRIALNGACNALRFDFDFGLYKIVYFVVAVAGSTALNSLYFLVSFPFFYD